MINQQLDPYRFSAAEQTCITLAANNWDSQRNCIADLKEVLNIHFDTHQNECCCYCGLLYDRTGRGEIEHIAPKGIYPQFSFHRHNLIKSCQLCNSSSMKHTYDSVSVVDVVYENCIFKIVHPYLDDHREHYRWKYGIINVVISVHNNSPKAQESIRLFELSSEKRTRARARERNQRRLEDLYDLPDRMKKMIYKAIRF
jgi:uncharacterized protein (TIGR02646 family)